MLIYYHKEKRRKQSPQTNDCVHQRCYQQKCMTLMSSFFVQLFIVTTIMATAPKHSTVAMDILNDHSTNSIDGQVLILPATNQHHQIVLNEKWPPHQKINHRSRSSMTALKLRGIKADEYKAASRDQSKPVRDNSISKPPSSCNCSTGKSTKSTKFHVLSCMQICSRQPLPQQQQPHQHHRQPHSNKFKRKRKQNINQRKFAAQKREHLTLIYGIDAISNSTQSYQRIVPIQSSEMTATKFRRKSPSNKYRQQYNSVAVSAADADVAPAAVHIDEKSLNHSNAHETNKPNHIQIQALTPTNLQEMAFYSDKHLGNFQNIDIKNNRWQSNAIDDAIDEPKVLNNKIVQSNDGKNVKRKTRSIKDEGAKAEAAAVQEEERRVRRIPSTQIDAMNMTKSDWQKSVLSATKYSSSIKSTVNGIFDSSKVRGEFAEIIGTSNTVALADVATAATVNVDANRATDPTASYGARTAVDGGGSVATGDIGINDYVNYALEDNGALRNPVSNLQHTEQQHIDLSAVVKSDEEWPLTNTQQPLNTDKMISGGINATCGGVDGNGDTITCYPENVTCVGDPEYCNLTELEYLQMLYDYIFPTPGEWVLIGFHAAVFIVGLIGNILVCIAVYANTSMRTVTNIFIVNLAIADLLVIILCLPPTVIWDVTETWFLGEAMCKVILYFQTVSVTVSILSLTFISIDRWYAICFPLRYVSTNGRAWFSVGVIWIGALVSDIPEFINSTTKKKELRFGIDLFTQCVSTWDKETEKNFYIARFGVLYLAPLFFMSIAYFKIIRVLWKSDTIPGHRESCNHNQMHTIHARNTTANSSTLSQLRARRKAAKMLVVVVLMFGICYLPVHCLNIMRYTIDIGQNEVVAILSLISHWLCYANSAVNPLIYNFMSGKFRREFLSVLERCRCSNRDLYRHHSCYFNTPGARLNTISPNTRSLCQFASHRDRNKSFREKHTIQTSFIENVCDIYPGDDGQKFGSSANGTTLSKTIPNGDRLQTPTD